MTDETPTTEAAQANSAAEIDPTQVDANALAKNMSSATDAQLEELMAGPTRPQILAEIFRRMSEHFRPEAARDTEAVIRWRITGRSDGGADEYETEISDGRCEVREGFEADSARVTFSVGGGDFLRLVIGNVAGPMLFMSGRLKIEGDMMFAASAASMFTIPSG